LATWSFAAGWCYIALVALRGWVGPDRRGGWQQLFAISDVGGWFSADIKYEGTRRFY